MLVAYEDTYQDAIKRLTTEEYIKDDDFGIFLKDNNLVAIILSPPNIKNVLICYLGEKESINY